MSEKNLSHLGPNAVIIGFGVTGQAVVKYLLSKNKKITVYDSRSQSDFTPELLKGFSGVNFNFSNNDFNATDFDFIVASPGVHLDTPNMMKAFENKIPVYNDITLFAEEWRRRGNKIVGITGSNGKTTMVSLMYDVIKDDAPVIMGGNIGLSPLEMLEKEYQAGTWAILELSSYQLEMFRDEYLDISVIANLSSNHLDRYHGEMSDYARAKTMGINPRSTNVIINLDDEGTKKYILPLLQQDHVKNIDAVSMEIPTDQIRHPGIYTDGAEKLIFTSTAESGEEIDVVFDDYNNRRLIGIHNLYNIALVLATIYRMGITISEEIITKIRNFEGLEHRIEPVININGVQYINDSKATSPDSTRTALETVSSGKNVNLIIGGEDKNMLYESLGENFVDSVKLIILLPGSIDKKIIKVANDNQVDLIKVSNMAEAVKISAERSVAGDVVLLSPASASFHDYKSFEERGKDFKEQVQKLTLNK